VRRRLIVSTGLIAVAAVLILGVPLGIVEARHTRAEAVGRLEREADAVAAAVDDRVEAGRPISPALIARHLHPGRTAVVVTPGGTRTVAGPPIRGETLTQRSGAAQRARITVSEPREELDHKVLGVWLLIAALGALGVAAATGLAAMQARRIIGPLDTMAVTSRRLGHGDFSARAGHFGIPELDVVAEALDASAERIAEMVAREREFAGNVSHQLRTPLTALRLRLEEVAELDDPGERRAEAELALAEADRLDATIGALLEYTRSPLDQRVSDLDLDAVVDEHVHRWRRVYRDAGRPLRVDLALHGRRVRSSAAATGQVLDVLLENALRHGRGTVSVATSAVNGRACLAVADEGTGIREGDGDIFERGTSRRDGSGIGLHLARTLARAHAGQLVLAQPAPPRFELRLQIADES
jgi:signal transduction histidine kinase